MKINEVESERRHAGRLGGARTTPAPAGRRLRLDRQGQRRHPLYAIPAGTTLAAGGYLVVDERRSASGSAAADSARLFATDGTTRARHLHLDGARGHDVRPLPRRHRRLHHDARSSPRARQQLPRRHRRRRRGRAAAPSRPSTTPAPSASNMSGLAYEGTGTTTPGHALGGENGPGDAVPAGEERPALGAGHRRLGRGQGAAGTPTAPATRTPRA